MDGKAYSKLFAFGDRSEPFSIDLFRGGFDLDDFLAALCQEAAAEREEDPIEAESSRSPARKAQSTKQKVQKLLNDFKKAEQKLRAMHQDVIQQLHEAQSQLETEQEQYKGVVEIIDRQFADLRRDFSVVDTKIANFGQIGARIGERLKRSFERETCAQEALELIKYLEDFSSVKEKGGFSGLPALFVDDAYLPSAAEIAQKLLLLSSEMFSAKARLISEQQDASPEPGTLEYSMQVLQEYCNHLENRVGMQECAEIMAKLQKETVLAQVFKALSTVRERCVVPESNSLAIMDLQSMYRDIITTVKHEAQVIESVFPSSHRAMELFLQRVLEQRMRSALDAILVAPEEGSEPEELRDFIRLVAQVYEKTHTMAINLERVTVDHLDIIDLCDGLVSEYISNYPRIELEWLAAMKRKQDALSSGSALDVSTIMILIEWNKEAVNRCKALSAQNLIAPRIRQLFHSSTYYEANLGCLLEQFARHIMEGLRHSFELCESGSSMLIASHTLHDLSNKSISTAAENLVSQGIGQMFAAVNQITQMITHLQTHYASSIEGHVAASVAESAACSSGLSTLVRAIEEKVLEGLETALHLFFGQIEKILVSEQKRNEYRPNAGTMMIFDRPTVACQLVCGLLDAMRISASQNLRQPNLNAFLEEAGYEASACLSVHMTHFTFSPAGALRLKRDMAAYIETVRKFESAETLGQFETLQQLVNVFIVAPESLIGLVDGSLRMSHKDALKYVQLREDFKTARVDGSSLAQLFASDTNEFD